MLSSHSACSRHFSPSLLWREGEVNHPSALHFTFIHMKTWSVSLKSGRTQSFPSGQNWESVLRTFQRPSNNRWGMQAAAKKLSSWFAIALCFYDICTTAGGAGELHSGYFVVSLSSQAMVMSLCIHRKKKTDWIKLFQSGHGKVRVYFSVREEWNLFIWNCYLQWKVLMIEH